MTSRKESCLGCGQMPVAVPAGGGLAHLSLALPISLFSAVEKATDGVRRFCSVPSAASSVCPALFSPRREGGVPGEHGDLARPTALHQPPGSTAYRERSPCVCLFLPPKTLLPPRGCKQQLHPRFEVVAEWRHFFTLTKQGLSALKSSRQDASCKQLIFH